MDNKEESYAFFAKDVSSLLNYKNIFIGKKLMIHKVINLKIADTDSVTFKIDIFFCLLNSSCCHFHIINNAH